jgi:hypothetical protein
VAENLPPLELSKREQQVLELVVTGPAIKRFPKTGYHGEHGEGSPAKYL